MGEGNDDWARLVRNRCTWILVGIAVAIALAIGFAIGTVWFWKLWRQPADWGDVPTWFAAVAAAVAGGIALRQLRAQLAVNRQDADDRRRAQAAQVYIGPPLSPDLPVYVKNGSELPVYDAQLWYVDPDGVSQNADELGMILPADNAAGNRHGSDLVTRAFLTFRDSNSVRWIRYSNGTLKEQTANSARDNAVAGLKRVAVTFNLK